MGQPSSTIASYQAGMDELKMLPSMVDEGPVMTWQAGPNKLKNHFNRAWLQYRGRTLQEEIGHGWTEGVHPQQMASWIEEYEASFNARRSFQTEYKLQRSDGAYRWMMELGVPRFSPDGAFLGYLGCCLDINERKLVQETLSHTNDALHTQNDELKAFVYGASHDLQEPLRTISIYTDLLAKTCATCETSEADQFVRFVIAGVQRMQLLIRDLSEYSYVVHRAQPKIAEVDCNAALEQARFVCQAAIQQTQAVINQDRLPTVRADQTQLVQVLQNLISNAIKYRSIDEPPRVHVSATLERQEWLFRVSDNGIGFDPRYAERIFGLFQRLHSKDEYSGSGIGLAICKKVIERHGGRIWAESEPGRGSSFFFTLP